MPPKHLLHYAVFGAFVVALASACSQAESLATDPQGSTGSPPGAVASGAGGQSQIAGSLGQGGAGGGQSGSAMSVLCGQGCLPETGVSDSCSPDSQGVGGMGGQGPGGQGPGGQDSAGPPSCKLVATEAGAQGSCTTDHGSGMAGSVCFSERDCSPGFGCVHPGVCRAYCCGDSEACPEKTFCKTSTMVSDVVAPELTTSSPIPTCTPVTPCTLLDASSCPDGMSCSIVREDGTTSCISPGPGVAGEACPCAADHLCANITNTCYKICRIGEENDCPAGHSCQGGSKGYPSGFGICVSM